LSPLQSEDAIPDIAETPARALTRREVTTAQRQNEQLFEPPKPAPGTVLRQDKDTGRPPTAPSGLSAAEEKEQAQPEAPPAKKKAESKATSVGRVLAGDQAALTPEQAIYYQQFGPQIGKNPWLPLFNEAQLGAEAMWNVAHHVGAGWNALIDPAAMSAAQHEIWSRNDAVGKLMQFAQAGPAGLTQHDQAEWFFENIFPVLSSVPAYLNPVSGTALLGLGLAGEGPENLQQVPGAAAGALPIAEAATVAKHPEAIKDPEVAARFFWKAANAALLGFAVVPFGRVLRGLKLLKPEQIQELQQSTERLKALQPGDPAALPDGELLKRILNLPPLPEEALVAKAAKRDIRQMERQPSGEYADLTARHRARIRKALGIESYEDLPHVVPNWTPAQAKLARKTLPGMLPYDLTRKNSKDIVPEDPNLFVQQMGDEAPLAAHYLSQTDLLLAQIVRGPTTDPLNAAESMTHSIPAIHEGTKFITHHWAAAEAALMEKAGVTGKQIMRAIRDQDAYAALPPAGKAIVNAKKLLRRAVADQSRKFGYREGFIANYDPRIRIQEEEAVQGATRGLRGGSKGLTAESKAHREEQFIPHPDDPARIALAEKYKDVFELNRAMSKLRQDYILERTKSNRQRSLENLVMTGSRDKPAESLRALTTLNEMEGKWPAPDPKLLAKATQEAKRRYPLFEEDLHLADLQSLPRQIMALHSHIGLQQALSALAHDGNPLAFERTAREIPAGYKKLENASKVFDNYVFHPDFANPLNRISHRTESSQWFDSYIKANQLAVSMLMIAPMIHGDNLLGRALWLLAKHPIVGTQEAAKAVAHSTPWSHLESLFGLKHASDAERIKWQRAMEMEAVNAGVIPHLPAQGFSNVLFSQYGKRIGDATAFERPGTRELWRLPPAFQAIPEAARMGQRGYDWLQNLLWGRIVMPVGIFAFHVEKAAFKAANPGASDLVAAQYAAHMANRWQGAIEPMARSQAMNTIWNSMGFAINWVRSFYELALPSYLSKSALAAHPELRGYVLRQELQSLVGMFAAQHISGNVLNMILSGHPQWENQPQNRYALEISRPEIIRGLQAMGLYLNIDPETGLDPRTGGVLTQENPLARQQLQMERVFGAEEGITPAEGVQYMVGGHLAPITGVLASAFNVNLPLTILSGSPRYIDQSEPHVEMPWDADLLSVLANFTGVGSTLGRERAVEISGREQQNEYMPPWLKDAPVPEAVKRYAAPSAQLAWNYLTGARAPYVKAERTEGEQVSDANFAQYQMLSTAYKKDMTDWSSQLMTGQITPYEWRTKYAARAHEYSIRLDQIFAGAPEYKNGALGLYAGYQKLYDDAQLPDGTGVDWGKLDGLQADYMENLTAAQRNDLEAEIGKHENIYPALGMYHATIDAHTKMAKDFAETENISYGTLMAELQEARSYDDRGFQQYVAQHPELSRYYRAQTEWEINTWPGRLYSLYYHTSALARWLLPTEGGTGPEAEEKALQEIEQHYQAPAAATG
jgi:hypothetical protein